MSRNRGPLTLSRPTVRGDRRGYVLDQQVVEGFDDRPDLSLEQRTIIARLCRKYSPKALTPQQREFLRAVDEGAFEPASATLVGFSRNELDLEKVGTAGFLQELSSSELRYVREPGAHRSLKGQHYPLTTGEVATLCQATERQIRHWADSGLIPSYRIDGQRRFFSAGLIRAMVLAKAGNFEVSTLAAIARGGKRGERLLRLIGSMVASLAEHRSAEPAAALLGAAGSGLVLHSSELSELLHSAAEFRVPASGNKEAPDLIWESAEGLAQIASPSTAPFRDFRIDLDEALAAFRTVVEADQPTPHELLTAWAFVASARRTRTPKRAIPEEGVEQTRELLRCAWQYWRASAWPTVPAGNGGKEAHMELEKLLRQWRTQTQPKLAKAETTTGDD